MEKRFSKMLGGGLAMLTLVGFILPTRRKRFLGLMNVDSTHSVLFYIAMGTAGLSDRKVGGALPSGLTNFDIVYHFAVGGAAIWLGSRSGRMMKP
jgi:hypothetical protein